MMLYIKRLHIFIGLLAVAAFIGSGLYMKAGFPGLYQDNEAVRMMFRANHIYILFAALLNILVGAFYIAAGKAVAQYIQYIGSLFLLVSPLILAVAFIVEPLQAQFDRSITFIGVVTALIGAALLCLSRWQALDK